MSGRIRGQIDGGGESASEYGVRKGIIVLQNLSAKPTKNDRDLKLGLGDSTGFAAMIGYDSQRQLSEMADGVTNNPGFQSRRLPEPDNWILRAHVPGGLGRDTVWALRMVAEHENDSAGRKCRSTMVIDQAGSQSWAWLSDLFWVKNVGTEVAHKELGINGAGIPHQMYGAKRGGFRPETATGSAKRAALALAIPRNLGHYTDGLMISQLWHVLHLTPEGAGGGVRGEMELPRGSTVAEDRLADPSGPGQTQASGSASAAPTRVQGTLRGDVNFDMEGYLAHIAMTRLSLETGGDPFTGPHYLHRPLPFAPGAELATDPKSNHKPIDRVRRRGIWNVVFKPRPEENPPQLIAGLAGPGGAGGLATGAAPDTGVVGVADAGDWRPPVPCFDNGQGKLIFTDGYQTFESFSIPIPEFGSEQDLRIKVPFTIPVDLGGADEMEFRLFYKVYLTSGETIGTAWTELTKTLDDTYGAPGDADLVQWLVFEIDRIGLATAQNRGGGRVQCYFFRRSDDAVAKDFYMIDNVTYSWKPSGATNPTFAGVL